MKKIFSLILFSLLAFMSACTPAATAPAASGGIEISNALVVLAPIDSMPGMDMGADFSGYMQIKNVSGVDDRLIGVTTDFASAMLHETTMNGDVASMQAVTSIDIPAGNTIEFKHGGLHIMFMDPTKDLKVGDTVSLTLKFEKAGTVIVTATVTEQ